MNTVIFAALLALAPWQDPQVNEINRLPARAFSAPAESEALAVDIAQWKKPREASRWVQRLDGEWDFKWKRTVDIDWEKSGTIKVPSCWQLQGEYDPPLYTNDHYPIAMTAPDPMQDPPTNFTSYVYRNPVGQYTTTFKRPWYWWFRKTILRFEGVSSAMEVRVNGEFVGYSEDSRLPAEFDVSPYLKWWGENTLEVTVYKHSDGTYLEDQDFWRLSGIFRSVYLISEHENNPYDLVVETTLSDDYQHGKFVVRDEKGNILKERDVEKPQLWSCEKPNVYMTPLAVKHGWWIFSYTDHRVVAFGFRKVEIKDSVLYLNGKRAIFAGVNRHEMDPNTGYTMSRGKMLRDADLMKCFNINAVRTCHYPDDPDWYELCDRMGFLVVCEANVESHGYGVSGEQSLSYREDYLKSHIERGTRMVKMYRNHPSIVIWSLGNESGDGPNFEREYEAMKAIDSTRPIQYENFCSHRLSLDWGANIITNHPATDIECPMYARPWEEEAYLKNNPAKPYILCEYTHAMGNSNGGVETYWDLVWKYPSAQGGFVWDFADQALWKQEPGERERYLAYGGDYGDFPNSNNFNCNGMFDALREPHPGAYEIRHAYQMIAFKDLDWKRGMITIENRFMFEPIAAETECRWEAVDKEGKIIAKGNLDIVGMPAGSTKTFKLEGLDSSVQAINFVADGECEMMAWQSFRKPFKPVEVVKGKPCKNPGFKLNLWRAPTDNDRGWHGKHHKSGTIDVCGIWKKATETQVLPKGVKSELKFYEAEGNAVIVDWTLVVPEGLPPIPRVGLTIETPKPPVDTIDESLTDPPVSFTGLGPWENYSDRCRSAIFARHTMPMRKLNPNNYVKPGEQGYRSEVTQLDMYGLSFDAINKPFGFNIWPYSQSEMENKAHRKDMRPADYKNLTVNIDAVQMGVGGDDSWGARPAKEHQPGAGTYRLVFKMTRK